MNTVRSARKNEESSLEFEVVQGRGPARVERPSPQNAELTLRGKIAKHAHNHKAFFIEWQL